MTTHYVTGTRQLKPGWTTHGLRRHPLYRAWKGMLERCYSPTHKSYHKYGGRGIKVCDYLKQTPANYISLLGDRPAGTSLNRKNNDLHYSCGTCGDCLSNGWELNVEWSDYITQANNTRHNTFVEAFGQRHTIAQWERILGIKQWTVSNRIRLGWTGERLLSIHS